MSYFHSLLLLKAVCGHLVTLREGHLVVRSQTAVWFTTKTCLSFGSFQIALIFLDCKAVGEIVILGEKCAKPPPSLLGIIWQGAVKRSPCRSSVHQHLQYAEGFRFVLLFVLLDQTSVFAMIDKGFLLQPNLGLLEMALATKWAKSVSARPIQNGWLCRAVFKTGPALCRGSQPR